MKLIVVFFTAGLLQVSAKGLSQTVTFSGKDVPLETLFSAVKQQTGYLVFYDYSVIDNSKPVSVSAKNEPLREFLAHILKGQFLDFTITRKTIFIKRTITPTDPVQQHSPVINAAPVYPVSGQIINELDKPLSGASINIKGSKVGTSTGTDGRFTINVSDGDVLVVSFVGYLGLSVKFTEINTVVTAVVMSTYRQPSAGETDDAVDFNGNPTSASSVLNSSINNLLIKLYPAVSSLNEVIINKGYYTEKQRFSVSNVARVTAKTIEKQPVNNPLQALQGRMTGVYIQQQTGVPGGGFSVQIRGQNSLRTGTGGTGSVNGNLPLYVINGVPFTASSLTTTFTSGSNLRGGNPLSAIDPRDIESIEVLKDADATAIYGSRGANGVILITTKRAKDGKAKVTLNIEQGIGRVSNTLQLLNTSRYLAMRREAISNDGHTPYLNDPIYKTLWPDLTMWDTTRYTNWQKELIGGTAHTTNAHFSLAGGTANTQFLIGGGYYRESTVFPGDNHFQRVSGKMDINHESDNKRLRINASVNYTSSINNIPSSDFSGAAITLAPNAPSLYDSNGNINFEFDTWTNPIATLERKYKNKIDNLVGNALVTYEVLSGLNLQTNAGYTSMIVDEVSLSPLTAYSAQSIRAQGIKGSSYFGEGRINTWIFEPQLNYKTKIGKGNLSFLIGTTFQESVQSGKTIEASGFTTDALLENIDAAAAINIIDANYYQYKYTALFGRANFAWKDKFLVNLTGRRDGSSRFGSGKQFANFGAAGAAWIFSNENFARQCNFLSFGKIRSSYGMTGSDAIANYQYIDAYAPTTYPYNGSTGLAISRLSNADYSWETNRKFEVGLDLGMFKDRLSIYSSYYLNRSSNQLVGLPLPVMTGQSSVQFNLPAVVENKGWEFQVNSTWIQSTMFQWTTSANLTIPSNRLLKFPDLDKFPAFSNRYDLSKSVYVFKGYQYGGVDPQTGLYTFTDLNNDGVLSSPFDLVGLKSIAQKYYGGVGNNIKYGNLEFDFFFQFVNQTGTSIYRSFFSPGGISNQPVAVMKRWQQPGDQTTIQRFTNFDPTTATITAYGRMNQSDHIITDASFIRLKNVSLSWTLPASSLKKLKMQACKIYLQGQNLFTITNYEGLDPENQISNYLPSLQVITAGITLSF